MTTTYESRCGLGRRQYDLTVNEPLYKYVTHHKPDGVYAMSAFLGVAVWLVDSHSDECIAAWDNGGYWNAHRHAIEYSAGGRPFIRKGAWRFYLDEFLRTAA